ncbi:hypothetical protein BDA99DRAFT_513016 [Phascolomyces articulosus]|uniref:Uncharacterized protein n=1 Tax=Phascolomyces articulosus TaxID=60185 RepID=A0AAD5PDI0_9FUNG|nr:hypothetical protein BDA99DRAFT_513016 [Phascolomyces articulosus]
MPAGPVSSALSPPPRHTMTKRKLTEPPTSRSPVLVRLSIDLREEDENLILRSSPDSIQFSSSDYSSSMTPTSQRHHPFRSGTLGNNNGEEGFFSIPTTPVPEIPLKERRKRRSPLSIPDDLTLSLNNKSTASSTTTDGSSMTSKHQRRHRQSFYYSYQYQHSQQQQQQQPLSERRNSISSITSSSSTSSSAISEERHKAMNALEGLDRDKAQYDAVVGRRRTTNVTTTSPHNEPTPSLTPNSRPLYYPSSPSSVGTIVEESAKFTISAGAVCSSSSPPPPLSPQQLPPLPTSRIPESTMRH